MTRGRHHNDAYIATTGEDTALDSFTDAITYNWIDQPALARQAELAGHNQHRPGTLPSNELQSLLAQQAQLTTTLTQLRDDLDSLPRDLSWAQNERRSAVAALDQSRDRLQRAHDTLAAHDRPFRRRGHERDIAQAKRAVEDLPGPIRERVHEISAIEGRIADLEQRLTQTRKLDLRRPTMQTRLDDIDSRLRTRHIRRDAPERITSTLGARPAGGEPARTWDAAAERLDQHQTAYGLTNGLGPSRGPKLPIGFLHSRSITKAAERNFEQAISLQRRQSLEREGPVMRIGR